MALLARMLERMALRCLIVDDSSRFLRAARVLLEGEGIAVVGVAATAAEALTRAGELRPDVVLIDIHLGEDSGFTLVRQLDERAQSVADLPVPLLVLISTHAGEDFADLIAASPAVGFLAKADLSARAVHDLIASVPQERR
ncbi:MAG: response regulator [Actinobacteria bacterium]|nr:MAG: response regulator [Actinomycetota bacterium]